MQDTIRVSDTRIGDVEWKLPSDLVGRMAPLPSGAQQAIRSELEKHVRGTLCMLMAALKMGHDAEMHLDHIKRKQIELAGELKAMAIHSLGGSN